VPLFVNFANFQGGPGRVCHFLKSHKCPSPLNVLKYTYDHSCY
jgi:hypothetical protein